MVSAVATRQIEPKAQLAGQALLQKIKNSSLKRRELAEECGYVEFSRDGQTRVKMAEFYDAVLAAKGVVLQPEDKQDGRGRESTYRVSVHKNGSVVVGANYTSQLGLEPGDEFEIKLGYKHIHLVRLDSDTDDDE